MVNLNKKKINLLLQEVLLKKKYIKKLKTAKSVLDKAVKSNLGDLNYFILNEKKNCLSDNFVSYIIIITFSPSNTFFHVTDFSGNVRFFYSAGSFSYKGRLKRARFQIFKKFYQELILKLKYSYGKPVTLHLVNVKSQKKWIIKKLKRKFFIKSVRFFYSYPHNGCRKKKMKRKKFKRKKKIII